MSLAERIDPVRGWAGIVVALVLALAGGSLLAPGLVYDRFIWQYFWGPVYADAHGVLCAVKTGSGIDLLSTSSACAGANGVVAYIGYTAVSEVGYAVVLLLSLVGVVFLLRALDAGSDRGFFFALLPYMFLGGAVRVIEDANDAVPVGAEAAIQFPWNALIISPVIYFTMFALALAALVVSVWLARTGRVSRYELPLAGIGTVALVAVIGYLLALAAGTTYVSFYPQIAAVVLVGATLITWLVWRGIERFRPALNRGTGTMGAVVVWAHTVDGVANVVGIDWAFELTGGRLPDLVPKHPVNRFLIGVGEGFPEAVQNVIGVSWTFLLVKVVAAILVLYLFDETIFEDSPRYSILLLVAIVAVGLGPGTRDMLRATFGI